MLGERAAPPSDGISPDRTFQLDKVVENPDMELVRSKQKTKTLLERNPDAAVDDLYLSDLSDTSSVVVSEIFLPPPTPPPTDDTKLMMKAMNVPRISSPPFVALF